MSFSGRPDYAPIHDLQTMLRTVVPEQGINQDGIYGEETKQAVAAFQQKQGLPVTGVTDEPTWEALKQEFNLREVERAPAEPLLIILQPGQVIEKGSENLHLYLVQGMLKALGRVDPELPVLAVNGRLDTQTAAALIWLQRLAGLEETGDLDKNTWRHLAKQYRLVIGDGTGRFPIRRTQTTLPEPRTQTSPIQEEG